MRKPAAENYSAAGLFICDYAATAGRQHPVAYGVGNVGGSLALMYGAGKTFKRIDSAAREALLKS